MTAWLWPSASTKGPGGCEVTPGGSPESVSVTVPVKPFSAVTEMEAAGLVVPKVAPTWAGDTDTAKSWAGVTIKGSGAECVSVPLVPLAVTVKLPAATDAAQQASRFGWLLPQRRSRMRETWCSQQAGRESETDTEPVKPFVL